MKMIKPSVLAATVATFLIGTASAFAGGTEVNSENNTFAGASAGVNQVFEGSEQKAPMSVPGIVAPVTGPSTIFRVGRFGPYTAHQTAAILHRGLSRRMNAYHVDRDKGESDLTTIAAAYDRKKVQDLGDGKRGRLEHQPFLNYDGVGYGEIIGIVYAYGKDENAQDATQFVLAADMQQYVRCEMGLGGREDIAILTNDVCISGVENQRSKTGGKAVGTGAGGILSGMSSLVQGMAGIADSDQFTIPGEGTHFVGVVYRFEEPNESNRIDINGLFPRMQQASLSGGASVEEEQVHAAERAPAKKR